MRTAVTILVTRLWCRHALEVACDATRKDFIDRFVRYASPKGGYGLKPSLLQAWLKGTHAVSKSWVNRVEHGDLRGTAHVYLLKDLLKCQRLSAPGVLRRMKNYVVTRPDGSCILCFPNDVQLEAENRLPKLLAWDDSAHLVERGDFFGLLAILAALRHAGAQFRLDDFRRHAENLYRLLPSVLRLPWIRPDVDLMLQCVEDVVGKSVRLFRYHPQVNWEVFRAHLLAPTCEINQRMSAREPVTGDPSKPADVIDCDRLVGEPRPVPLLSDIKPLARYVRPMLNSEKATPRPRAEWSDAYWKPKRIGLPPTNPRRR